MYNERSEILPYALGLAAIGGAVGYLFMTESGRRMRDSVMQTDTASAIPDKIEDARQFIERRGNQVGGRVKSVVDTLKESIEQGRQAYEQSGQSYHQQLQNIERKNSDIVQNIHRAIDNLNRTIHTFQVSVLDPLYEMGAIARGVDKGVRQLAGSRRQPSSVSTRQDIPRPLYGSERFSR